MSYMLTSTKTAAWYEAKGLKDSGGDVFVFLGEKLKATNVLIPHPLDGEDAGCAHPSALGSRGVGVGGFVRVSPAWRVRRADREAPDSSLPPPDIRQDGRPGHLHQRLLVVRPHQQAPHRVRPRAHARPAPGGGDGVPGGGARGGRRGEVRLPGVADAHGEMGGRVGGAQRMRRGRSGCWFAQSTGNRAAGADWPCVLVSARAQADPLSERKGSTTVRWARPQGKVLVRLQLTKKPGNKARIGPAFSRLACLAHAAAHRCFLTRLLRQFPPLQPYIVGVTDVEEAERKAEEEKRLLKAQGLLEDSEDEEEGGGKGKKKKGPKKKGKDDKPGFFEPGGTFGAAPDPEVVQAFSMRPYKLRVFLYQAVGIPATDSTGSSDPFCVVRCGKSVTRTQASVPPRALLSLAPTPHPRPAGLPATASHPRPPHPAGVRRHLQPRLVLRGGPRRPAPRLLPPGHDVLRRHGAQRQVRRPRPAQHGAPPPALSTPPTPRSATRLRRQASSVVYIAEYIGECISKRRRWRCTSPRRTS